MSTMGETPAGSLPVRLVRGAGAGIVSGAAFLAVTMWFSDTMGDPARMPLHMMSTILKGDEAMMEGTTSVGIGVLVHLVLSVAFGATFAVIVPWLRSNAAIMVAGTAYGALLFVVNFLILAELWFTTFEAANKPFELFAHVVFGMLVALALLHREAPSEREAPSRFRHRVA